MSPRKTRPRERGVCFGCQEIRELVAFCDGDGFCCGCAAALCVFARGAA